MESRYQVFVSSTFADLKSQRRVVADAIQRKGWYSSDMEAFPPSDKRVWRMIERAIEMSDLYLLLLGNRYGSIKLGEEKSFTELEYEFATQRSRDHGLRIAVLVWDSFEGPNYVEGGDSKDSNAYAQQMNFHERVLNDLGGSAGYFSDEGSLALCAMSAFEEFQRDAPTGWVRAGESPNHEQVVDVERQLELCRHRLAEAGREIESLKKVRVHPRQVLEIGCDAECVRSQDGRRDSIRGITTRLTWKDLYCELAQELCDGGLTRKQLSAVVSRIIRPYVVDCPLESGWEISGVAVLGGDFDEVVCTLVRNGWVETYRLKRTGQYYQLTESGMNAYLESRDLGDYDVGMKV